MIYKYFIIIVEDSFKNKRCAVVEEFSDDILISGLMDRSGLPISFEGEAYHLEVWCDNSGFTYKIIEKKEEV